MSVKKNVAPASLMDLAQTLPPCRWQHRLTVESPTPTPANSDCLCMRWKGLNSLRAADMSNPAPLSRT